VWNPHLRRKVAQLIAVAQQAKLARRVWWLLFYFLTRLVDCRISLPIARPLFYNVRNGTKNRRELYWRKLHGFIMPWRIAVFTATWEVTDRYLHCSNYHTIILRSMTSCFVPSSAIILSSYFKLSYNYIKNYYCGFWPPNDTSCCLSNNYKQYTSILVVITSHIMGQRDYCICIWNIVQTAISSMSIFFFP
jgi:hypothetical protein